MHNLYEAEADMRPLWGCWQFWEFRALFYLLSSGDVTQFFAVIWPRDSLFSWHENWTLGELHFQGAGKISWVILIMENISRAALIAYNTDNCQYLDPTNENEDLSIIFSHESSWILTEEWGLKIPE